MTPTNFPDVFNKACHQALETDPAWHQEFESADLPSLSPAELHTMAARAPNPFLAGFLSGQAVDRSMRG